MQNVVQHELLKFKEEYINFQNVGCTIWFQIEEESWFRDSQPQDYLDLYIGHMARSMGKEVHSIEGHDERCAVKRRIDMKKVRQGEESCFYLRLSRPSQWMTDAIADVGWSVNIDI